MTGQGWNSTYFSKGSVIFAKFLWKRKAWMSCVSILGGRSPCSPSICRSCSVKAMPWKWEVSNNYQLLPQELLLQAGFGCVCLSFLGFPHFLWAFLSTTARPHSRDLAPRFHFPLWNWRPSYRRIKSEITASFSVVSHGSPRLAPTATDSNRHSTDFYLDCSLPDFFLHTFSNTTQSPSHWTALTLLLRSQVNPNTSFSPRARSNLFVHYQKASLVANWKSSTAKTSRSSPQSGCWMESFNLLLFKY